MEHPQPPSDNGRFAAPPAGALGRLSEAANLNRLWADLLVEELVRCGVGLFCIAPGSRSAPLAIAVAIHPTARHLVHFDERGSAFAALGWARATGRPACWVTTSGTALAHGLPAVIEASLDGVPLMALTADRPPELRQTGANQTIAQPGLFGAYVRWQFDLPTPTPEVDPAFVLTTVDQAVYRATHQRGPVHLNVMFREPLAPDSDGHPLPTLPARWLDGSGPYTRYADGRGASPRDLDAVVMRFEGIDRGLVVAGRLRTREEGEAAVRLADHLGWPLIADLNSQVRLGNDAPNLCIHADLVLASDRFCTEMRPEAVIHIGARGASKRVAQFLAAARPDPFLTILDMPDRFDPFHVTTDRIQGDVAAVCDDLVGHLSAGTSAEWADSWRRASDAVLRMLTQHHGTNSDELSEVELARLLSGAIPPDHGLVIGSSMPIRDMDAFAVAHGPAVPVFANRGASGIDGTIATAAGVARGLGRPVTVLLGDLAFLHDLNSLALLNSEGQPPVAIVVVNNNGGGIFHFLSVSRHDDVFEPMFGTPHGLSLGAAADLFGLDYVRPQPANLEAVLRKATRSGRSSVIEVVTSRTRNHAEHVDLLASAAASVEAMLDPAVT